MFDVWLLSDEERDYRFARDTLYAWMAIARAVASLNLPMGSGREITVDHESLNAHIWINRPCVVNVDTASGFYRFAIRYDNEYGWYYKPLES